MSDNADPVFALLTFMWQGAELYSCHGTAVPRAGDWIVLGRILHPIHGEVNIPTRWRVQSVEWTFTFQDGVGELRPEVDIHLRRLCTHEWGNRHEPTGATYEEA